MKSMELGTIEREIHVDASPEVVFDVVSRPEHISQWWTDEATLDPAPGAVGELVWGERTDVQQLSVVTVEPPRVFAFRWCYPDGTVDESAKSLLVTFELTADGGGTRLRMTETGFREMGWEAAKLEETYRDHASGWDHFVPRLAEHAAKTAAS